MIVCERCGRRGTKGFVLLRGKGDGGYGDQWRCAAERACAKRQTPRFTYTREMFEADKLSRERTGRGL